MLSINHEAIQPTSRLMVDAAVRAKRTPVAMIDPITDEQRIITRTIVHLGKALNN